ncbi:MAG: hypothetical protein ABI634_03370 [Acidobacteriota bacterium]
MKPRLYSIGIGLLLGAWVLVASPAAQTAATRTIYVSVLDGKKAPVAGLTAADFALKEGGKARDLVKVEVATAPLHVALVIDDDDQGGRALKAGLSAFAKKMTGRAEIAIVTTRGGANVRLPFTKDSQATAAAIDDLPLVSPGLANLTNGMLELGLNWSRQPVERSVIVAIASPGIEVASTEDGPDGPVPSTKTIGATVNPSSPAPAAVQDALRRSHTIFYMLHLDTYSARGVNNDTPRVQYSWPVDAPAQSGGRTERIVSVQGVTPVLERIADELLGQYALTYQSPDAPTGVTLDVDVKRKGLTVRAPQKIY